MKLLADVNVDRMIVAGLRTDGHDVEWLAEDRMGRRMPDDAVIRLASRQSQIILTYDTDFARYIFTDLLPSNGVVLLRVGVHKTPRAQRNQRALEALHAYQGTLLGRFTTIYPDRVEQQALPPPPTPA